jgi:predicted transcriptional regulator
MDFKTVSKLCGLISKDYAEDFFKLLVTYKDISSSEAASRLNIHIKTAQDFLEGLERMGICSKREVFEQKRPYFRFTLERAEINIRFDLSSLTADPAIADILNWNIRERKNSGAMFRTSRGGGRISFIHFFVGEGRTQEERKINLTGPQGFFLFHLPFPTEPYLSVAAITEKANIDKPFVPEILDIVHALVAHAIIEKQETTP